MGAMASQITSLTIVYSSVYSDTDQRVRGIHRLPMISPLKWPVTRKMFPFHGVIMQQDVITIPCHNSSRRLAKSPMKFNEGKPRGLPY